MRTLWSSKPQFCWASLHKCLSLCDSVCQPVGQGYIILTVSGVPWAPNDYLINQLNQREPPLAVRTSPCRCCERQDQVQTAASALAPPPLSGPFLFTHLVQELDLACAKASPHLPAWLSPRLCTDAFMPPTAPGVPGTGDRTSQGWGDCTSRDHLTASAHPTPPDLHSGFLSVF